jgi:phenylalanyl-tRNA synthetase beta chain
VKVSLEWLREYAALDAPLDALVRGLIDTGTEVDQVQRGPVGAIVARLVALQPVPESTRGVLFADLDVGGGERLRVLTGAPNLHVGDLVPYAPPGTQLPGMSEPLGVRAMFGGKYASPGMLCSAAELGIGENADGIHVLDRGLPGEPLHEALDMDTVLDVEVTTNRPDCLCHVGIAREMAAAIGEAVREPATAIADGVLSAASIANRADVDVQDPGGCPRFAVRIIENVVVGPSPAWLQRRLRAVGLRPINNIVDVTNYVARELGQPLHGFDLDRFVAAQADGGRTARVVVRRGRDEALVCLDNVERRLGPEDMVVCAGEHAASIAGVIGGQGTAVDESTRNVLLEAASWDGPTVRATSKRLGVRTDASALYEKNLSDTLPPLALERAAGMIAELGGGHVLQGAVDERPRPLPPIPPVPVSGAALSAILGYAVDATEAATALAHLGFGVEQHADVAEEVGRSLGYDRVPSTLPGRRAGVTAPAPEQYVEDRVKDLLVGAGCDEAITWSFSSPALAGSPAGLGAMRGPIRLRNPLTEEWSVLRTSLLPGVVAAVAGNLRRAVDDVRLFEIGRVFWEGERQGAVPGSTPDSVDRALPPLPAEPLLLAMAATAEDAAGAAGQLRALQSVLARLGGEVGAGAALEASPEPLPGMRAGRAARITLRGAAVGVVGELDTATVESFDIRRRVVVAELQLDAVVPAQRQAGRYHAPPRHPAVVQDLAVTVPVEARAGDALAVIRESGGALLEQVELYDEYRGEAIAPGRKSWTFRLTYRAPDHTLTSAEAADVQDCVVIGLRSRVGAEVRT